MSEIFRWESLVDLGVVPKLAFAKHKTFQEQFNELPGQAPLRLGPTGPTGPTGPAGAMGAPGYIGETGGRGGLGGRGRRVGGARGR
jgi:hypothetical protein